MHDPQIISIQQISDGAIAVRVRCCGDPSTDSSYTEFFTPDTDFTSVQSNIESHKTRVADQHATAQKIQDFLATL